MWTAISLTEITIPQQLKKLGLIEKVIFGE